MIFLPHPKHYNLDLIHQSGTNFKMSRINYQNRAEGHRVEAPSNRDLEQKLTYQQLLNLNHDLSKENQQLKNIGTRYCMKQVDSARSYAVCIPSSTSNPETKITNSTTPSARTPCSINMNSLSSPSLTPTKQKFKNLKADLRPSTKSSSISKRSTLRSPPKMKDSEPNSQTKSKSWCRCTSRAVLKSWELISGK